MKNLTGLLSGLLQRDREKTLDETHLRDQCLACDASLVDDELYQRYRVCPACHFHYSLGARDRIHQLADPESFLEINRSVVSLDPLSFSGRVPYRQRLLGDQLRTGLTEAVVTGTCTIEGLPVLLIVLDFSFLGGSMGSVVGEKVTLAFEYATKKGLPVVAAVTSGGARIQEGVLSLMQMAKTTIAATHMAQKRLPFIAVLANPTTGQVFASFANLADIIIAEPGAIIGFAPPGVLQQDSKEPLSLESHVAEAQLTKGAVDMVVDRQMLRDLIGMLLDILQPRFLLKARQKIERKEPRSRQKDAWESVQLARHSLRPTAREYIDRLATSFIELHGDRIGMDDPGVYCGLGYLGGQGVAFVGQERGLSGEAQGTRPQGLWKSQRIMALAAKFSLPLITLIDTSGVALLADTEIHIIGNALATTTARMGQLETPTIAVIIGEGGSEAALAFSVADCILMMQHAIFSPISPEGAATLMYRDQEKTREAAEALRLTAMDCYRMGIIDAIVPEPEGGAHRNPNEAARHLQRRLLHELVELQARPLKQTLKERSRKFRRMGEYSSQLRVTIGREVEQLQSLVAQGVKKGVRRGVRQGVRGVKRVGRLRPRRVKSDSPASVKASPSDWQDEELGG